MPGDLTAPAAGEKTNKLWQVVAQLVAAIRPLQKIQLSPASAGDVKYSDGNVMITLKNVGSGGGGADHLETVTGAVNGVAATLKVQTDGLGWTEV